MLSSTPNRRPLRCVSISRRGKTHKDSSRNKETEVPLDWPKNVFFTRRIVLMQQPVPFDVRTHTYFSFSKSFKNLSGIQIPWLLKTQMGMFLIFDWLLLPFLSLKSFGVCYSMLWRLVFGKSTFTPVVETEGFSLPGSPSTNFLPPTNPGSFRVPVKFCKHFGCTVSQFEAKEKPSHIVARNSCC